VIRHYRVDPANLDALVARARNGFLPLITHLPGFATYCVLDAGGGTLVTLSGFTSSSGASESTRAAASFVREHLGPLVPDAPTVIAGAVRLAETAR
jgi:hypothetical protein